MAIITGLLEGFNTAAETQRKLNAADLERNEVRQMDVLKALASTESVDPEIRNAAVSAMLDVATGQKLPKGGVWSQLIGTTKSPLYPSVQRIMDLVTLPQQKGGGLPMGVREVAEPPQSAATAAEPPPPAGPPAGPPSVEAQQAPSGASAAMVRPGPGPTSPSQLPSMPRPEPLPRATLPTPKLQLPTGPDVFQPPQRVPMGGAAFPPAAASPMAGVTMPPAQASTQPAPPALGPQLPLKGQTLPGPAPSPVSPSPSVTVQPHVFRSIGDVVRERNVADAQGDVEGEVAGLIAAGASREDALKAVLSKRMRATGAPFQSVFGEAQDEKGNWYQTAASFNRYAGIWEDPAGNPLPTFRARTTTGSTSLGGDRESISLAVYGKRFAQLPPGGPEQRDVLAREQQMIQSRSWNQTTGSANAAAGAPLSTEQRYSAITAAQTQWNTLQAPVRVMEQQFTLMQTGLKRFIAGDRVGGQEAIRVTFEKILDPASVVREGEYTRQGTGRNLMQAMEGLYQKYLEGGGEIPLPILQGMVETANQFLIGARSWNQNEGAMIDRRLREFGIDPTLARGALAGLPGPPSAAPGPPPVPGGPGVAPASPAGAQPPPSAGGPAAPPPSAGGPAAPGGPRVGDFIGNEYTGTQVGYSTDGRMWGKDPQGITIELFVGPNGKTYIK